jgi:hypothetical protein
VSICQRATSFDPQTGEYELCAAEVEEDTGPVMLGVTLGGEQVFIAVDLCMFHIVASKFAEQRLI